MPSNKVSKELIDRFFRKECTPEEAKEVAAYLKANPSVLEEYLSDEEWNVIVPGNNAVADDFWNETWQNIRRSNKNKDVVRKVKRVAVAASVIVLVVATVYYSLDNSKEIKTTVAETPANKASGQEYKTVRNDTKQMMHVVLDDNSVVELSPASSIQYEMSFGKMKRDISLEGEARFSVTKNKAKPFTVYAGGFTTTALGTVFIVRNNDALKTFTVRLFEGKVVIHSINNNVNGWWQDVYLIPGERLEFNELSGKLAINKTTESKPAVIAVEPAKHTVDSTDNRLNFSNAGLPEVMHTLAGWYNINILYDSSLISKMNFTGMVSRNDSPEIILKVIAQTNGLEVSKNDTAFIIYKP